MNTSLLSPFNEHSTQSISCIKCCDLRNEIVYPFIFETCAELSVHVNIPQNRKAGFYAFLTITKSASIESYYLNFDQTKNEVKIQANQWVHDDKKIGFMDLNGKLY